MSIFNLSETVRKSTRGDKIAFGQLVQKFAPMVTGTAFSVCGDFAKSEDLAQEAFVEAWKSLASLRDPEKFVSWVCTISRRRAIDHLRSRKMTSSIEQMQTEFHDQNVDSPETAMAARQHRQLVWSMLESLPETYRETMVLFYRAEQSTRDVAIAMGESEATVRQRLKRGREMIRAEVTDSIREALMDTAPQASFASSVVAALPALSIAAGASATTGAVAAVKTTGIGTGGVGSIGSLGLAGAIFGPVIGMLGGVFGTWNSWRTCDYESQQRFIIRQAVVFCVFFAAFLIVLAALVSLRVNGQMNNDRTYAISLGTLIVGFQLLNVYWIFYGIRTYKRIGEQAFDQNEPLREYARAQREQLAELTRVNRDDGREGYEAFQWNAGSWFGAGLGATVWMLPTCGFAIFTGNLIAAAVIAAIFSIAFVAVISLWRCRSFLKAYDAFQIMIVVLGLVTVAMFATMQFLSNEKLQQFLQWTPWAWLLLLMFPILSFHFSRMRRTFEKNMLDQQLTDRSS